MSEKPQNEREPLRPGWLSEAEFPWSMRREPVPGGRMAWLDEGEGPAVVLVHGTPSSSSEWRHVVRSLVRHHRVLCPDHLGFGLSDRPADPDSYTLNWHTRNLDAWLRARALDQFDLVLHDFGGPIALPLVLSSPERVRSLTIIQSWAWSFDRDPGFRRSRWILGGAIMRWLYLSCSFAARVMVPLSWGRRAPLARAVRREFLAQFPDRASRAGTWGFARSLLHEREALDELEPRLGALAQIPTQVLWGEADSVLKPWNLARWRAALPRARFEVLPDVGHFPQLEVPDEVARILCSHIDGADEQLPSARPSVRRLRSS
jgi:haloalkane dehalogenase